MDRRRYQLNQPKVRSTIQRLGKTFELVEFWAFDEFQNMAEHGFAPVDDALFVAAIDKDFEEMRQGNKQADQHEMSAAALGNAR